MQRIAEALNEGLFQRNKPRPKGGQPKLPKKLSREAQMRQATK